MNTYLQIAAGLLPGFCLFLILFLAKKGPRIRNIIVASVLFVGAAAFVVLSFVSQPGAALDEAAEGDILSLIYSIAEEGEPELASKLLLTLRKYSSYDVPQTLCAARLYAMQGDYTAANALYGKVILLSPGNVAEEEYTAVSAVAESNLTDYVLLAYFEGDENAMAEAAAVKTEAQKSVAKAVDTVSGASGDAAFRAAKLIISANELYDGYIDSGSFDEDEAEKQLRRMNTLTEEYPEYFSISELRTARLRLQILCEDYKGIAGNVDERSDHNELLIVSELYTNGYIKASYFPEEYTAEYGEICGVLAEQLQKVYDKYFIDQPRSVRDSVKQKIKSLEYSANNPAMYLIAEELLSYTAESGAYDSTKVFLQLAKIAGYTGDDSKADEYLSSSLNTAGDCDDDDFTQPMYEIISIISDKDDPEKLKDVADYVDKVLENSMTIKMSEGLLASSSSGNAEVGATGDASVQPKDFSSYVTDYVSKKRASINIVSVDTLEFDTVRAVVNVDDDVSYSAEKLKEMLSVQDCGVDIADFTVEKVEYSGANILLCCDVSGSMGGTPIENLKEAVALFIDSQAEIESIALVTFNDGVKSIYSFGTSSDSLSAAAASLSAGGGTNVYGAVIESIGEFTIRSGEINCIILLSDGQDNTRRSAEDISAYIGAPCLEKGVTLYSIGLGPDVDAEYLNTIATSAGGSYLYVNDSSTLYTFYEYLHNQILNQYIISFTAEDTLSVSRTLKVSISSDSLAYDVAYYSLEASSDEISEGSGESGIIVYLNNKAVYGLETRLLFKSNSSYKINLMGEGFEESDKFTVDLKGNIDYKGIPASFVDDKTLELTIPAGIACGTYDLHVTINGKKAILDDELTVAVQGSEKATVFGPYVFTSYSKVKNGDTLTLSGYVSMNSWLNFTGDVLLTGDIGGTEIRMYDDSGCYIKYNTGSSKGLAAYLAGKNMTLSLFELGHITLYNDQLNDPGGEDYRVNTVVIPVVMLKDALTFSTPGLSLYPDRIVLDFNAFTTEFPFQDKLMKSAGLDDMFSFTMPKEFKCLLTADNIGIDLEYKAKGDGDVFSPVNFGSLPMYYSNKEFELKINTIKSEYSVKYITKLAFLKADGLGLSLKWTESLIPSEIKLYADFDINSTISGVPVTYSDFSLGIKDIDTSKRVIDWTLEGSFDLSAAKISSLMPGIEDWVGDVSVVKLDNTTVSLSLGQCYLGIKAKLKLLESITVAEAEVKAGNFTYSNIMLNMDSEAVFGILGSFKAGVTWDSSNCDIKLTGGLEFSITNRYVGIMAEGTCKLELSWWIFTEKFSAEGKALIGMYYDHSGDLVFCVKAAGSGSSKALFIAWSSRTGMNYGTTKL